VPSYCGEAATEAAQALQTPEIAAVRRLKAFGRLTRWVPRRRTNAWHDRW
jgi:hypothetical protein